MALVVDCTAWILKRGAIVARTAAVTTGRCSGKQPAMTMAIAIRSTVASPFRCGITPMTSPESPGWLRNMRSTRSGVGGMIGSPSVHPCSQK